MSQLSFGQPDPPDSRPYSAREKGLAMVIAGFAYPGRGSFEALKKGQKERVLEAARLALDHCPPEEP